MSFTTIDAVAAHYPGFQRGVESQNPSDAQVQVWIDNHSARITALAMGRNWRKASPEQKKQLTDEFRTLLVRTYSTALTKYRDQAIEYKPLRAQPGDTDVTVRSSIQQPGAEAVTIDYSMEKTPAGWKIYDVTVAGISLLLSPMSRNVKLSTE